MQQEVVTVGVDLAKNAIQVHAIDASLIPNAKRYDLATFDHMIDHLQRRPAPKV